MKSRVRAHVRRAITNRITGVRSYTRNIDVRILSRDRVARSRYLRRFARAATEANAVAGVTIRHPRVIYIVDPSHQLQTPDDVVRTISHETLHQAFSDIGERHASKRLDAYHVDPMVVPLPVSYWVSRGGFLRRLGTDPEEV